jgi:Family of unknown function (DUF6011)
MADAQVGNAETAESQKTELAELFKRAFSKHTASVRRGEAKVNFLGELTGIEFTAAKEWLEEAAAERAAKRRAAAQQAAVTRARRREFTLYELVKRYIESGVLTPAAKCRCCNKRLSDPQSEQRGIGSECWSLFIRRQGQDVRRAGQCMGRDYR